MTVSENIDQAGNKLKEATAKVSDKSAEAAKIVADKASVAAETLSRHAGRAADEIGAQVAAEARDTINEVAGSRKHRAGRYLSSVGAAIDASSDKLSEDGLTETANYAQSAARNVRKLAGEIEGADIGTATVRVENFMRSRPLLSFGSALLLGFAAYQVLKSGQNDAGDRRD